MICQQKTCPLSKVSGAASYFHFCGLSFPILYKFLLIPFAAGLCLLPGGTILKVAVSD